MRHNRLLLSGSIVLAWWINGGIAFSQTSGGNPQTIHPDVNESKGGSKSERGGGAVPLPKGDPSSGTVEEGKSGETTGSVRSQSDMRKDTGKKSASDTSKGKDTDRPNKE